MPNPKAMKTLQEQIDLQEELLAEAFVMWMEVISADPINKKDLQNAEDTYRRHYRMVSEGKEGMFLLLKDPVAVMRQPQ